MLIILPCFMNFKLATCEENIWAYREKPCSSVQNIILFAWIISIFIHVHTLYSSHFTYTKKLICHVKK